MTLHFRFERLLILTELTARRDTRIFTCESLFINYFKLQTPPRVSLVACCMRLSTTQHVTALKLVSSTFL